MDKTEATAAAADMIGESVYTRNGEIAIVTRVHGDQIYGLLCTGPLANSTNVAGEWNEFLIILDAAA